jgi:hypothetical protein
MHAHQVHGRSDAALTGSLSIEDDRDVAYTALI